MRRQSNRLLSIVLVFTVLCLGYFICDILLKTNFDRNFNFTSPGVSKFGYLNKIDDIKSELILNTPLCRIPRTPIFPSYFNNNWKQEIIPDCSYEKKLGKLTEDGTKFELLPEYHYSNCSAAQILRKNKRDSSFTLTNKITVEIEVDVKDWEFFVITCGISLNFEVKLSRKIVKSKENFWTGSDDLQSFETRQKLLKMPIEENPINVILIGIDSVSRSHAHRSLPKTIKLFKKMGFHDFQGYHSVAPSTLTNFMAFLMGLLRTRVRETCSPDWKSYFDSCPFIWKNYAARNYVTMYIEDGEQTFNWGGQSGFKERPTDYYAHHFFNAVEKMRSKKRNMKGREGKDLRCTSSETSPEFVTRYTTEFIKMFSDLPFFAFTWYAYPFHGQPFTVQTLDNQLVGLYKSINSSRHLLENSLLVFLSDHGDRNGFFLQEGMDGYIERGLPPLFIRIPEQLLQLYPGMRLNEVMEENSRKLVSPFDLHHTLLHLLQLSAGTGSHGFNPIQGDVQLSGGTGSGDFNPVQGDRSSLLIPLCHRNGTCESLNIFPGSCVCNTLLKGPPLENLFYLKKIVKILAKNLNGMLKAGEYKDKCAKWEVPMDGIISTKMLSKTNSSSEFLVRFGAIPREAIFEGKVNISHEKTGFDSGHVVGKVNRINLYGEQSACLPFLTDEDKEMKAYCYCKNTNKNKSIKSSQNYTFKNNIYNP